MNFSHNRSNQCLKKEEQYLILKYVLLLLIPHIRENPRVVFSQHPREALFFKWFQNIFDKPLFIMEKISQMSHSKLGG